MSHRQRRTPRDLAGWLDRHVLVSAWTCALGLTVAFVAGGAGPWAEAIADFFGKRHPFWVREDFTAFYAAGKLVDGGLASRMYDLPTIAWIEHQAAGGPVGGTGMLPYFNPPFFALPFAPLAHLSLQQAYQVWGVVCMLLLVANALLIWRLARPVATPWRVAIVTGYLTLYPLLFGLRLGQFSLILQLSIALGFICLREGRDRLAGASLALLLVKPELLIPIAAYLAVKRNRRAFETLAPITVVALAVSIAMVGLDTALDYPAYLLRSTTVNAAGVAPDLMINWAGIAAASFGNGDSVARPLVAGFAGAATLAAVLCLAWRAPRRSSSYFAMEWVALVIATVLADPHFYLQDTIMVAPVAVAALATMDDFGRAIAGFAMTAMWGVQRLALYPNQYMSVNLFAIGLVLCLFGTLVWMWRQATGLPAQSRARRRAIERARMARAEPIPAEMPRNARRGDV